MSGIGRASFRFEARFQSDGRLTALFGPSGSGKTTLVNAIGGLVRPDSWADRRARTGARRYEARRLRSEAHGGASATCSRKAGCSRISNVRQNLLFGRWFTPKARAEAGFDDVVTLLGIESSSRPRARRRLSGGEKQRVAIGRALLADPAAPADGRAAGLARRCAQGRDLSLYRAPARRGRRADRFRQPFRGRDRASCDIRRRSVRGAGDGLRSGRRRSCGTRTCFTQIGLTEAGALIEAQVLRS